MSSNASESGGHATAERNPFAIARPHATDLMFQRQASFRGFGKAGALNGGPGNKLTENSPFKRQLSLRISDLPSTVERIQSNSSQGKPAIFRLRLYLSSESFLAETFCL